MSHLSSLQLDELAAGLGDAESIQHISACAACSQALGQRKETNAIIAQLPGSERMLKQLTYVPGAPQNQSRYVLGFIGLAAAAAVVLLIVRQPVSGVDNGASVRLKGTPVIEMRSEGTKITQAPVGQKISLALMSAGHPFAVIYSIESTGAISKIWPAEGNGAVKADSMQVVSSFEVTPGNFCLHGFFFDDEKNIPGPNAVMMGFNAPNVQTARECLEVLK
jgi:hypothetical protein